MSNEKKFRGIQTQVFFQLQSVKKLSDIRVIIGTENVFQGLVENLFQTDFTLVLP